MPAAGLVVHEHVLLPGRLEDPGRGLSYARIYHGRFASREIESVGLRHRLGICWNPGRPLGIVLAKAISFLDDVLGHRHMRRHGAVAFFHQSRPQRFQHQLYFEVQAAFAGGVAPAAQRVAEDDVF